MRAVISSHIALERHVIPPSLDEAIRAVLSIRNPDKDRALSEKVRGAQDLPDEIKLYQESDSHLFLPRGFVHRFEVLARSHGEEIQWDVQMTLRTGTQMLFRDWPKVELRDYQLRARDEMLDWANGIFMAPTGAGKTRVALEVARWAGQPTLIVVDKTALADQWRTVIRESYGYETGLIGDGSWDEKEMTVALRQSLWSRQNDLPRAFWRHWGMVILDEVQHSSNASLQELVPRFTAFYRLGVSATPEWDGSLFPMIEAVVGPIIHRTQAVDVAEVLVMPRVVVVPTTFEREYIPTHMEGRRRIQNNYSSVLMADLIVDTDRNWLIAKTALDEAEEGHHVLITTRRTEHVRHLVEVLHDRLSLSTPNPWSRLFVLTGKQSARYESIRQQIAGAQEGTILVSTIADEALDIPRLGRLIMAFPARRVPLVEQQIGRIRRPFPGKTDAIAFDIYDEQIGVMRGQYRDRMQQLYLRRHWPTERREVVAA